MAEQSGDKVVHIDVNELSEEERKRLSREIRGECKEMKTEMGEMPAVSRCAFCSSESLRREGERNWCQDCGRLTHERTTHATILAECLVNLYVEVRNVVR